MMGQGMPAGIEWFQSTRLHEARPARLCSAPPNTLFQSTRLHEARLGVLTTQLAQFMFQSTRLHEARLTISAVQGADLSVSIHAPA